MKDRIDRIVELIEITRDLHKRYDELGIAGFDQDLCPGSPNKKECGCAMHTINCAGVYDEIVSFKMRDWREEGVLDYWYYIFGCRSTIVKTAENLKLARPYHFTPLDVVERCNTVLKRLKGDYEESTDDD
jgi:hypothetical protein